MIGRLLGDGPGPLPARTCSPLRSVRGTIATCRIGFALSLSIRRDRPSSCLSRLDRFSESSTRGDSSNRPLSIFSARSSSARDARNRTASSDSSNHASVMSPTLWCGSVSVCLSMSGRPESAPAIFESAPGLHRIRSPSGPARTTSSAASATP